MITPPPTSLQVPTTLASSSLTSLLLQLPTEILLHILTFLAIPDLLALSRTCHALRPLPLDPLLHRHRLALASHAISVYLPQRPSLSSLRPPARGIYLTRALFQARQVSQRLAGIRLNRRLGARPSVGELVERGVLPTDCFVLVPGRRSLDDGAEIVVGGGEGAGMGAAAHGGECCRRKDDGGWVRTTISPQVIATRQSLERERVKDRLRSFLSGRGREEMERRGREQQRFKEREGVGVLVRRFAKREMMDGGEATPRWGSGAVMGKKGHPARANVLGMRRFWESVGGRAAD